MMLNFIQMPLYQALCCLGAILLLIALFHERTSGIVATIVCGYVALLYCNMFIGIIYQGAFLDYFLETLLVFSVFVAVLLVVLFASLRLFRLPSSKGDIKDELNMMILAIPYPPGFIIAFLLNWALKGLGWL